MAKADTSPGKLITAYSNNAELDEFHEVNIEFEPVCPKNGWSMNEIWKHAYISPPPGYWIHDLDMPCRTQYDYGEPAGYPTAVDPHSTLPNDWTVNDDGEIVVRDTFTKGRSRARQQSHKRRVKGR